MQIKNLDETLLDGIDCIERDSFSSPWSKNAYRDEINNPLADYAVIIDENGTVIAYGGYWNVCGEGNITNIAVKKEYRNRHIGTMLMNELLARAKEKNISAMTLEVRKSNIAAISLYKKQGFVSSGVRPGYYPDGEDAVIMWLTLGGESENNR